MPDYSDFAYMADPKGIIARLFLGATFDSYKSGGIKLTHVFGYLEALIASLQQQEQSIDQHIVARAFRFYTIMCLFFPNANSTILVGWLAMVEDVS